MKHLSNIEIIAMQGVTPVKLHDVTVTATNPLEIANQLKSLKTFLKNREVFGRNLWYKVNFEDQIVARTTHSSKLFKQQLPLCDEEYDAYYPYNDIPRVYHASVWEVYAAIGYNHKTKKFVGIGNIK